MKKIFAKSKFDPTYLKIEKYKTVNWVIYKIRITSGDR